MFPQVGVGGMIPSPKKLKLASVMIAAGIHRVANTRMGENTLGRTWKKMIFGLLWPRARAASTKSASLTERVEPRTSRENRGTVTMEMATMTFQQLHPQGGQTTVHKKRGG